MKNFVDNSETVMHLLWDCVYVCQFWEDAISW